MTQISLLLLPTCHLTVTLFLWCQVFLVGSLYHLSRTLTNILQQRSDRPAPAPVLGLGDRPQRVVAETIVPVVFLTLLLVGWGHQRLGVYLCGSVPVVILALLFGCAHADILACDPTVPVLLPAVLYVLLTIPLVLDDTGSFFGTTRPR